MSDGNSAISDVMLTTLELEDGTHFLKSLDGTWCEKPVTRESRQSVRDVTAGELDAEGSLVCWPCQKQWFLAQQQGDSEYQRGKYAAVNRKGPQDLSGGDPEAYLTGYMDGMGLRD